MNSRRYINQLLLLICILVATATSVFAIEDSSADALLGIKKENAESQAIENEKKYIKNIEITGTSVIKPEYIIDKMSLRRGDVYNRDLLKTDLTNIYKMGFFSDKMKAIPVENPDHTITLKIIVEENIPVVDFTIEGNTVVSTEELLSYLLPLRGKPQNVIQINEAIEAIQNCYAAKGYVLARISEFTDDPDGVVNIKLSEGTINKIMIEGNEKTKDYIVARNILTEPGMVYNENLIKQDLVRLYATQAYKDVNREIEPSLEDPDRYDVTISVQEQRTASISIGGGIDSGTGFFGSAGISDNNFRGRNQRVGLNFLAGSGIIMSDASVKRHANLQAELSFFEPYFLNADTSFMGKVFFRDFGSYQVPLAIEQRFGGEVTVSHRSKFNPKVSTNFSIGLENIHMREGDRSEIEKIYKAHYFDIADRAEQLQGGFFLSLAPGLVYDSRDTVVNPRSGVIANVRFEENIGLDGLKKTNGKLTGSIRKYFPVLKKSSFSLTAKAGGFIHSGEETPEVMAYRLGGPYTVRGFKMSGVGTGKTFVMGSAELATPFFFLDRIKKVPFFDNIKFTMFVDAGKMFKPTITDYIYDRPMQAITAGVGLKIFIPGLGPLSVDYGIPITNPRGGSNRGGYFTFGVGDMMY